MIINLDATPIELKTPPGAGEPAVPEAPGTPTPSNDIEKDIVTYVVSWRNRLKTARMAKQDIWTECWQLYRGLEDFSEKEDWQSRLVLPKAWESVKQATNVITRLLNASKQPWQVEAVNPDDLPLTYRAGQMTDLAKVFLDRANYKEEFVEGLECGFIMGLGVWKAWWGLAPRTRMRVETEQVPMGMGEQPFGAAPAMMGGEGPALTPPAAMPPEGMPMGGPSQIETLLNPAEMGSPALGQEAMEYPMQQNALYPTQAPMEALNPAGWSGEAMPPGPQMQTRRQIVREEILEGKLFTRAVDPYNFYWLPGSKLNRWVGTIEEIEVPKWQLLELAEQGAFEASRIEGLRPMRIDETQKQSRIRFNEPAAPNQADPSTSDVTGTVKVIEFYGPLIINGKLLEKNAHVLIANDDVCLMKGGYQQNQLWQKRPPYVAFSPLALPFRTEGVGLVEMDRKIHIAISQLARLSMDTLMFRLLPVFEVALDVFENPQDLEGGLVPGKLLRRSMTAMPGQDGIKPIVFQDISGGTTQVAAWLDREHQGASMVSEIQQSMPRYRGYQSAEETSIKNENQNSFFGAMATGIEQQAIAPMVELAVDLILQFIDTANDPRVASILGVGADALAALSREEKLEMVNGDYQIKVSGITEQLAKVEMLQNLVQLMNLIGQNPEAWLPYVNQNELLRRVLEAFRPMIHDIDNIIADPETAMAKQAAASGEKITPELLRLIPQLAQMATAAQQQQQQMGLEGQKLALQAAALQQKGQPQE